jgi:two-component system, OmpR family, response regulator
MSKPLSRITYVEDEPDIRTVAEIALAELGGFTIDACSSGPEALERAPDFDPEMIVLDVMMPVMNGIETFRALQADPRLSDVPVVFMTARVQPQDVENYKSIGVKGVIPKPFDPLTLADEIRAMWQDFQSQKTAA